MLLVRVACLRSQLQKLVYCCSCEGALEMSWTDVLQASHCCTASLQALQARAAAHSTLGLLFRAGWSRAIERPSNALASDACDNERKKDTEQHTHGQQGQANSSTAPDVAGCHRADAANYADTIS
jgi:hypothetical protein